MPDSTAQRLRRIEAEIRDWKRQSEQACVDVASVNTRLSTLTGSVTSLGDSVTKQNTTVSNLSTSMGTLSGSVAAIPPTVTELATRLSALEAKKLYLAFAQFSLSGVLQSTTRDITVTWTSALPNTTYDVDLVAIAESLIGKVTVEGVVTRTTTTCTVRIRTTVTVTLSGSVSFCASALA